MGTPPTDLELMQRAIAEGETLLEAQGVRVENAIIRRGVRIVAVGFIAAVVIFAWMFRYDVQSPNTIAYFKFDRWTGTAYRCVLNKCNDLPPN